MPIPLAAPIPRFLQRVLMRVPHPTTGFWPGPVDHLHRRIDAATSVEPAVGKAVLLRRGPTAAFRCVGATVADIGLVGDRRLGRH